MTEVCFWVLQVWCVGNESQQIINRSVDGDTLWVLLDGLLPESMYRVQVAAVTSAGVGAHSQPVFIFLSEYRPLIPSRNILN